MKIEVSGAPAIKEEQVNNQPLGFIEFYNGEWGLGLVCYESSQTKQLVEIAEPKNVWGGLANFKFRELAHNTIITITL